jgi:WD40 repeat protein/tRNA A-37 threonylcarbamoyl transferase component Bud32
VPGYEIVSELGRGGMGVVYKARQIKLNRLVALKMILSGVHAGAAALARFRTEGEASARLQHPNIVQVYEVGEQGGLPYFSLEFCAGGSLERKLNGTPLSPGEAAELVETLARAMAAAHLKGVVHRDLKSANVLLAEDGTPKIGDFGLAKMLGEAGQTASGAVMGTPSYMAPEQAGGRSKDIGPPCDVYALGAILYECLTGRPPFKAATALDTILQVVGNDPVPPTRLNAKVPRDLETVCLKCLRKEPSRRYAGASELAEDLRRFRAGEPIAARPAGAAERLGKWVRRRPAVAALLGLVALLSAAGAGGILLALGEAVRESNNARSEQGRAEEARAWASASEADARRNLERARRGAYSLQLNRVAAVREKDPALARALLDDEELCPPSLREFTWHLLYAQCGAAVVIPTERAPRTGMAISPDGKLLAVEAQLGTGDRPFLGGIAVWDLTTGRKRFTFAAERNGLHIGLQSLAFSPDGTVLASCGGTDVKLWSTETGKELAVLPEARPEAGDANHGPAAVLFSSDGKRLYVGNGGAARVTPTSFKEWGDVSVWDVAARSKVDTPARGAVQVVALALGKDGRLAFCGKNGLLTVREKNGNEGLKVPNTNGGCLAFSPAGDLLAVGGGGSVQVRGADGKVLWDAADFGKQVNAVAFSLDGEHLAAGGELLGAGTELKLFEARTGKVVRSFRGHTQPIRAAVLTPDGEWLVSADAGGVVRRWGLRPADSSLPDPPGLAESVALSPDGRTIATGASKQVVVLAADSGEVRLWDRESKKEEVLRGPWARTGPVAFSPDGAWLAAATDEDVRVWDAATRKERLILQGRKGTVRCLAWSPGGAKILTGSGDGAVNVWDFPGGTARELYRVNGEVTALAVSPDGVTAATAAYVSAGEKRISEVKFELKLWDLAANKERADLETHDAAGSLTFSPDGATLASGHGKILAEDDPGGITLWDVATGRERLTVRGQAGVITALAYSPDGKTLASGSAHTVRSEIKLWDPVTGQERATLRGHGTRVTSLVFDREGLLLVSGGGDTGRGEVHLWRAPAAEERAGGGR